MLKRFVQLFIAIFIVTSAIGGAYILQMYDEVRFEIDKLTKYNPPLTTQIYDRKGRLIANLFENEFRLYTKYEEIPPKLIEALAAIEDTLFFEHNGINIDAIFRAIIKDIQEMRLAEGASTITQQLIKTTLLTHEKKISRKIKEVLLALKLESVLSKEEILERYLNQVYFGHGYYGIKAASSGYFKKELQNLTLKEIAMIVCLPIAHSLYDPTRNLEAALSRANKTIVRLKTLGWIEEAEFKEAIAEVPIIYNETLTQNVAPYVIDELLRSLDGKMTNLKNGGYEIVLNIDLDYQNIAQEAVKFGYDEIKQRDEHNMTSTLNGAGVVLESGTGKILALVGGYDYKASVFNRATQSKRQPGSSFKPFVYMSALNMGYSPASKIADISRTYEFKTENEDEDKVWQPKNYTKDLRGVITLREALTRSVNLATINLVEEVGFDNLYASIRGYGFKDLPRNLSIALGSFGISPLEMGKFFTIFANYGQIVEPSLIFSIKSKDGNMLYFDNEPQEIMPARQVYLMIDMLKDAVSKGTGKRAMVEGIEIAGKTGTTNDTVDGWFCGFTPSLEAIFWYGNDNYTPMPKNETGGRSAAPAFNYFFTKLLELEPQIKRSFDIPEGVIRAKIDGEYEFFTDISKPPKEDSFGGGDDGTLLF